jgi:drug/metabolite transporter (DMT)-like permease
MAVRTEQSSTKYLLLIAFGALCISFAAIFVKLLGREILGPTTIGFWRTLLGAGILFGLVAVKGDSLKLSGPVFRFLLLAGLAFFLDLFFWHRSILDSGAGMATILANTQVFWMALIGTALFRERLSLVFFGAVVAAFIGVVLLIGFGSDMSFSTLYIRGIVFGLLTGVVYSVYMTSLKKAGHRDVRPSSLALMAWASLFTSVFLGVAMMFEHGPHLPPSLFAWFILFALALIAQAIGWWVISTSLPKLRASQSGLVLLLQPTLATVWGWLFFNEELGLLQVVGAALTLLAIYVGAVRGVKKAGEAEGRLETAK